MQTHTQRRAPCGEGGRDQGNASTSQGTPQAARKPRDVGRGLGQAPPPPPQMEPTSSTLRFHFQPPEPELGDNPLSGWYLVGAVLANNMEASQREWGAEPLSAPGSCLGPHEMSGKWDLSTNWGQPSLGGPGLGSDS